MSNSSTRFLEDLYKKVFKSIPVGIGLSTIDGQLIAMNDTLEELLGYTYDELKALGIPGTYADPNERIKLLETLEKDGKIRDYEVKLKKKNGTIFNALLNIDITVLKNEKIFQAARFWWFFWVQNMCSSGELKGYLLRGMALASVCGPGAQPVYFFGIKCSG